MKITIKGSIFIIILFIFFVPLAKSAFRLASSLNLNELETNQEEGENSNEDLNTKFSRDTKLIDHLERQKEQTNRLLLKSKAKHNELISTIQNN